MDDGRKEPEMEDRVSRDGRRAKCSECGEWYGIDEAHGFRSPSHVALKVRRALEALKAEGDPYEYENVCRMLEDYAERKAGLR